MFLGKEDLNKLKVKLTFIENTIKLKNFWKKLNLKCIFKLQFYDIDLKSQMFINRILA